MITRSSLGPISQTEAARSEAALLEPEAAYALWAKSYPPRAHNALMKAEERAMLALLPESLAGRRVLDVGCGSGRYLLITGGRGAQEAVGVDLSREMLLAARREIEPKRATLVRGSIERLPVRTGWADITICGLAVGHVRNLAGALMEMGRATMPGGLILCSDFHPAGEALGWRREFKTDSGKLAVRHWAHSVNDWRRACRQAGLAIESSIAPTLDLADVPAGSSFDRRALNSPVVLVFKLRRVDGQCPNHGPATVATYRSSATP